MRGRIARRPRRPGSRGQSLVEFALVFPIAVMVFMGIIVLGLLVFYTQEVTNAAREAARYAAIHSSTAQCPTVSWRDPQTPPNSYYRCDPPPSWPNMVAFGRSKVWGVNPDLVYVNACWSGYVRWDTPPDAALTTLADSPAVDPASGKPNTYMQCTIGTVDPVASPDTLACGPALTIPDTSTAGDDRASDQPQNRVTAYACLVYRPPLAGFLLIPPQVTIRGVVTEDVQRQQ